jgi:aspartyl-tRNA(Asn)/glutamyl-tRNA(Gln) amidotransferase subunit C
MALTRQDVEALAHLARLTLSPEELERFGEQLGGILEYVDRLNRLDLSGAEPTTHAVPVGNRFREDAVAPGLPQEAVTANAPDIRAGSVRVPRILEE